MCKFYQGEDDGKLETMLGKVFSKVNRVKPETSRSVSSLLYLISLVLTYWLFLTFEFHAYTGFEGVLFCGDKEKGWGYEESS